MAIPTDIAWIWHRPTHRLRAGLAGFVIHRGYAISALVIGLVAALHFALLRHAMPQSDDLCYWGQIHQGYDPLTISLRMWTGRVLGNFAALLPTLAAPEIFDTAVLFRLSLAICLLSVQGGLYLIVAAVWPRRIWWQTLLAALVLLDVWLIGLKDSAQSLTWLASSAVYLLGFLLFAMGLRAALRLSAGETLPPARLCLAGLIIFASGLFHELNAMALALVFAAVWLHAVRGGGPVRQAFNLLATAALSFLFVALSPATNRRLEENNALEMARFVPALLKSLFAGLTLSLETLSPAVLLAALLSFLAARATGSGDNKTTLWVWIGLILTLPAGILLGYLAARTLLPARATNLLQLFQIIGWCGLAWWAGGRSQGFATPSGPARWGPPVLVLTLAALVLFNRQTALVGRDVFIEGPRYRQAVEQRFQLIQANPAAELVVPALGQDSRTLNAASLQYHWRGIPNQCMSLYFGKTRIRLASPPETL